MSTPLGVRKHSSARVDPKVEDFQGLPIVKGAVVCYNLSGELAVGVVVKAERRRKFDHRNVHIRLIKSAGLDTMDPLIASPAASPAIKPYKPYTSKVKDKGIMVLNITEIEAYNRFVYQNPV